MNNRQLLYLGAGFVLLFAAVCVMLLQRELEPALSTDSPFDAGRLATTLDAGSLAVSAPPAPAAFDSGRTELMPDPPQLEILALEGEGPLSAEQLQPAIAAVGRIVDQCFADITRRYPGQQSVTLSFEVRADGERAQLLAPELVATSLQDPFFNACVTDAPLDVTVELPAIGASRVRVPYRYPAARE